ncbi:MAG: hypothetical protein LBJ14_11060 [Desulfarculales bacterium]|nr:hypothetical protein [Desulfarculales bacterium]
MDNYLEKLRLTAQEKLSAIPESLRQTASMRQIIVQVFYAVFQETGWLILPAWQPPRSDRQHLDAIGFTWGGDLPQAEVAMVADPLIELPRVRALEQIDCPWKVYVTFGSRPDKIRPTTLFLKPEHRHLNIFA